MEATIKVRSIGQAFTCDAQVIVGGKVLHTTREYPHGQRGNAYAAAEEWAVEHGYEVAS